MQPADPTVLVSKCHGILLISIKEQAIEVGGVVFCCRGRLQFQWNEMFGQSKERERESSWNSSLCPVMNWRAGEVFSFYGLYCTRLPGSLIHPRRSSPLVLSSSRVPLFVLVLCSAACYFTNRFWGLLLFHYPTLDSAPLLLKARNLIPHKVSHFSHDSLTFHSLLG